MRKDTNRETHGEFWWQRGAYQQARIAVIPDGYAHLLRWFNPQCRHERSAAEILTCDECEAYSVQMHAEWAEEKRLRSLTEAGKVAPGSE